MFTNALVGKFFYFTPFYVPELNVGKIAAESCYQQNNNLSNGLYGTTQDTTLDQLMKHMSDWNHPFVFDIGYTLPIAPDKNNAVGIGERGMLHAFSYSGKHFYCIDASKGWQESPYALKSGLFSSGAITNPNTCTVPFSLVNGWHSAITNVPDAAKGKYSILLNIWEYGATHTGILTGNRMQVLITERGGGIFTRMYINSAWTDWA